MNDGTITVEAQAASTADLARLTESFRTFNRVTRDLESAYEALRVRADRIDERLKESHARLAAKVSELKRLADRLHATLDATPCGVVTCGADGVLDGVNRAAERLLGRPAAELVGRAAASLRGKDGAPLLLLGDGDGDARTAERVLVTFDGARRRVASTVSELPEGGRIETLSDLTETAHLRAQLNRLDDLAALGEMAAGVAHEIRNPLNGVEGFAGLLARALEADGALDRGQLARYVDRIRRGVSEVDEIIADLLMWARPEKLRCGEVRVAELCEQLRAEAPTLVGSPRHARFDVAVFDDGAPFLADGLKLKLILANLVRNALEAAGPDGRVRLEARRDASGLHVSVEDDGPGVSPEMRKRL
ncbi:MAG TPA: histidine kinase dimerization/phospho-acceptor domain-containing protein, partial [Planctomycetota bacterium]|nr:histidine kinase dimerization/phospho-acceptor domain-containing protein [Planctomycetota bacterium]